ncbi:MAG: hypothetical protein Q9160_004776 [Pyrenula sp. 1 TL-2023]
MRLVHRCFESNDGVGPIFEEIAKHEDYRSLVKSVVFLDLEELVKEHDFQLDKFTNLEAITIRATGSSIERLASPSKMCDVMSSLELERYKSLSWVTFLLPDDLAGEGVITPSYKRFLSHLTRAFFMFDFGSSRWSAPEPLRNLEIFLASFQRLSNLDVSVPPYVGHDGLSHTIFNASHAPKLHSLELTSAAVAGHDLIYLLERHKGTLRDLSLMNVKLDDTKPPSGPSHYTWEGVFEYVHDNLSLTDFYMDTCLMQDYGGGLCWVIPEIPVEWCACLEAEVFGSLCLRDVLNGYILREGPKPTAFWSTSKPNIDRAIFEDEERGWLDECKLKSPDTLGDCPFFGTKNKRHWTDI